MADQYGVTADMVKLKDSGGIEKLNMHYSGPRSYSHAPLEPIAYAHGGIEDLWVYRALIDSGPQACHQVLHTWPTLQNTKRILSQTVRPKRNFHNLGLPGMLSWRLPPTRTGGFQTRFDFLMSLLFVLLM